MTKKSSSTPAPQRPVTDLSLDGDVTISVLAELRGRFLAALEGQGPIRVRTREVTYLDAAALQLIWALRRECEMRARPIWVETPRTAVLKDAQRLGMQDVFFNPRTSPESMP